MAAGGEDGEEGKLGGDGLLRRRDILAVILGLATVHARYKTRSQQMSLHMMDSDERHLPCDGQRLSCI